MSDKFWKAALIRAFRTLCQTLGSTLPVGTVVTIQMVQKIDMNAVWAVLAWLGTGILSGLASLLTSIATGLPEVGTANEISKKKEDKEHA